MKTLLVKYTPRESQSASKALLDAFRTRVRNSLVEELDLCIDPPDLFMPKHADAYYARNLMGRLPTAEQSKTLAKMDQLTDQLTSADVVAVAFPMFNFSIPAMVKAWFDSVLQVGKTIDPTGGVYRGMMSGKKALVLVASGGIYSRGDGVGPNFGPTWEHAVSLAKLEFKFIGYTDIRGVLAEGMAGRDASAAAADLKTAIKAVQAIADEWYS